jgi:Golgi SNAP receptor complex protein 1
MQARKLESELDIKLASFRRLGNGPAGDGQGDGNEAEIERLLQQLNEVNKQMQSWVSSAGSDVLSHTLTRHRNILQELSQVRVIAWSLYNSESCSSIVSS